MTGRFFKHGAPRLVLAVGAIALLAWLPTSEAKDKRAAPVPQFSPGGGVFTNDVTVRLAAPAGAGPAVIRFTLDGSDPTTASPVFSNAVRLTNCAVIRARLFDTNGPAGEVASQSYTLLDPDLAEFTSNLPLVIIDSSGREVPNALRVPVWVRAVDTNAGRAALTGPAAWEGRAELALRGRSSLRYPKRSYSLRTVDETDDPVKVPLLGFPKEWDWILYAPYPDKTLMRDVLAYEWSNAMGHYATRTRFVEVFVNESGSRLTGEHYLGVFVLEEKIKQGKQRVNVQALGPDDLTEPDVTGGYIFKKDHGEIFDPGPVNPGGFPQFINTSSSNRYGFPTGPGAFPADPAGFLPPYLGPIRDFTSSSRSSSSSRSTAVVTNRIGGPPRREGFSAARPRVVYEDDAELPSQMEGWRTALATNHLYYVDPAPEELNPVQRAWLTHYANTFERALFGADFRDPARGYAAYLDPGSFIDVHLIVEVSKNVDGYRFSTFYFKDRGGRIHMGPIWDWNLSFGNCNAKQGWIPEYWLWPQLDDREYPWFRRLFEDPDFGQRYVDRFAELRQTVFATSNVLARIDAWARHLDEAQARNYARWPILGMNVHPSYYTGETYADEVNWMKQWIATRLEWIERQFVAAPHLSLAEGRLSASAKAGKIYCTVDGSDPRAPGGAVSPSATEHTAPLAIRPDARIAARTLSGNRWSAPVRLGATASTTAP